MTLLALLLALVAQTGSARAQDGSGVAATIHGRVVMADGAGTPLGRARVTAGAAGATSEPVYTDAEGRFVIAPFLPPPFTLTITKAGFAPHAIAMSETARVHDAGAIALERGAVVSGRVLGPLGDPVIAEVALRRIDPVESAASRERTVVTDDRGEFRIGSLPAGEYHVFVDRSSRAQLDTVQRLRGAAAFDRVSVDRLDGAGPPEGTVRVRVDLDAVPPDAHVALRPGDGVVLSLTRESSTEALAAALRAPPPGMPPRVPVSGRSTLRGRILDGAGSPIALARVDLIGESASQATDSGAIVSYQFGTVRSTVSDGNGRYEFGELPAGRYGVSVQRIGYEPGRVGVSSAPGLPGAVMSISGGPQIETVDVVLERLYAIEGRIVDEGGDPLEDVAVQAWRLQFAEGQLSAVPVPRGGRSRFTDDRGMYRIHGLAAGTYYVVAGRSRGRVITAPLMPPRVFHPGRLALAEATPVRLDGRFDAAGIDVIVETVQPPLAHLSGRVFDASGDPLLGTVTLMTTQRSGTPRLPVQTVGLDDAGRFEIADVPPGDYVLHAVQTGLLAFPRQFAQQFVIVGGDDVPPLAIHTSRGSTLTGRIVLEGRSTPPVSAFRFDAVSADPDEAPAAPLPGVPAERTPDRRPWAITLRDDGAFEMGGLAGPLRFVTARAPEGWWLKSVEIDGRNAVDEPVRFGTAQQSRRNVRVVFSDAGADIAVRVADEWRDPAHDAAVVVFSMDERLWFSRSPYVRMAQADANGQAALSALPPGDYWAAAVDVVDESGGWQRPEVLSALVSVARQVRVQEYDRASIELRLVRGIVPAVQGGR